jgi:hypothetical protein
VADRPRGQQERVPNVLITAIVLVVLWVLWAFVFRIIGGVVHLLLTIALIALVLHFVRGQNAAGSGPTALPAAAPQTERFRTMSRPSNGCEYGRISVRCDLLGTGSPGFAVLQCLSAYQHGQHRSRSD